MTDGQRIILCTGDTNYAIGYMHGSAAKSRVRASITNYDALFMDSVGLNWSDAINYADRFKLVLVKHAPHLLEEMQGIADGASVTLGDILALNARSEIALTGGNSESRVHDPPDGCTAFSKMTTGNEQYLGQNWDWKASQLDNIVVLRITTPTGLHLATITEAGIVAKVGMNNFGVGVTLNALKTVQMDSTKLPVHIALRLVLESESAAAAVQRLDEAGVASAAHFLIADPKGSVGVEVNPLRHALLNADEDGHIFHTNHCISTDLPKGLIEVPWLADSAPRLSRVAELISSIPTEEIGFSSLFEVFKDEAGAPNAINRAVDPATKTDICTVFNLLMNNSQKLLRISFGRPTETFETIELQL